MLCKDSTCYLHSASSVQSVYIKYRLCTYRKGHVHRIQAVCIECRLYIEHRVCTYTVHAVHMLATWFAYRAWIVHIEHRMCTSCTQCVLNVQSVYYMYKHTKPVLNVHILDYMCTACATRTLSVQHVYFLYHMCITSTICILPVPHIYNKYYMHTTCTTYLLQVLDAYYLYHCISEHRELLVIAYSCDPVSSLAHFADHSGMRTTYLCGDQ